MSLKLIEQLRSQSVPSANKENSTESINKTSSRILVELSLNESIRYANGDPVEKWLNNLLCLDASVVPRISSGCPLPEKCDLYLFIDIFQICFEVLQWCY